jgi:hypothetical protein
MPLTGESARLACGRRRLGDDHRVVWQGTPWFFQSVSPDVFGGTPNTAGQRPALPIPGAVETFGQML